MSAARPLSGYRVLDFTNVLAGPYCTRLLADMGAEVIKIEPPAGDHNRTRRPVRNGHSSFFGHANAGKRSVVLDLKTREGLEAVHALAPHCDIAVENWKPGVAARLGVGYDDLAKLRPDVVYCSISGFGQTGPSAQRPAYAAIVNAASGYDLAQMEYQAVTSGGADLKPANTGTFIADVMAGLAGFSAIQTALLNRQRGGAGQYIDVSMMDCMLNLMVHEVQEAQAPSSEPTRVYQPLRTRDGFVVLAPTSQKNFERLARAVGHAEWIEDARFAKTRQREANWGLLMGLIESGWTRSRTAAECEQALLAAGVPCTRYRTVAEALADPQLESRGSLAAVTDPAGTFKVPNPPFRISGLATGVSARVAALGEDTRAVLRDIAGYSEARIDACIAARAPGGDHD